MDNFINLAKQGYSAYQESHGSSRGDDDNSDYRKTGGEEYNSPHHSQQGSNHQIDIDHDEVVRTAKAHHDEPQPEHDSLYSSAHSYVTQNQSQHQVPVDEEAVQDAHREAYEKGSGQNLSASSLGSAAALQALKKFTGGSGGGGSQTELISMAMAEASKLFDKSGGGSSGGKQEAVNGAAMTVVKLLVKSKFSGGVTGGGNSGGLGSLMSLASKFA